MSDPQPNTSAAPPAAPTQEAHVLDKLGSKVFFSLVCFIAPVPLTVVITDFWLRYQGEVPEETINPLYFIKRTITVGGLESTWPLLLSLVPPILMLKIIFRDRKPRLLMMALLLLFALLQFVGLASLSAAPQ